LRDDFEVTCSELDFLIDLFGAMGVASGVFGAKMTGGGFGGCAISIIESGELNAITRQIASEFDARFGRSLRACVMKPSAGAQLL
jgi:galactokinase